MSSEHSFASLAAVNSTKKFKTLSKSKSSQQLANQRNLKKNKLFRRIEADIKERDRRRVPGRPEDYVDPNRGISVNLGPSDIRTSMLKSRTFLSKTYVFMQEEQQGYKVLVEQATHEMHKGAFDRALCYLNKAIRLNPDDPSSLIERAACHVGLQQFEEALEDTNKALKMKNYLRRLPCKGLYIKGDALYNLGNFEHALVFYYRALKRSASNNEEEAVRNRINRATKAIDNAIGIKASRHFMAMPAVLNKIPSTIFGMPWHELRTHYSQNAESKVTKAAKKKHQRNLLGKLSKDLDYLETLLTEVKIGGGGDPVSNSANDHQDIVAITDEVVSKEASEAISFLRERQEFWSQFKPMYCK